MTYTGDLPPERFNLARYCFEGKAPDKTALIVAGAQTTKHTYGEIEDTVLRMAEGLRRKGIEPRDRLFIRMGNSLDFALVFFAANAAGAVPIPASPMLTIHEVAKLVDDCGAKLVASDGQLSLPPGMSALTPDDIASLKRGPRGADADTGKDEAAYLICTSGTSRAPKGVLHAQRAVWGRRPMYQGWYGIGSSDVLLHTGAFNWTFTLGTGLIDPLVNGATSIVYTDERDIAVWQTLIDAHGATIMASVPGLYRQMLRAGFKPGSTLRHGLTAGEALPLSIYDAWTQKTGRPLFEAFGMSEISTYISSSPAVPIRRGSPGKPQPGRSVTILDGGLIAVHRTDPGLMLRYWNRPEEDALVWHGEWFTGGDLGRVDADGYVWLEGRADEIMNAGGFRVSPIEVESVIAQHPDVAEVGVAEVRVSEDTAIIGAFIVPASGHSPDEKSILAFTQERLAAYKCPRLIRFVTNLPRTANGKLIHKALGG